MPSVTCTDRNKRRCEIETEVLIARIKQILEDKKASDLVVLDVRERSTVTDWIIVASGMSKPHIKALYDDVLVQLKHEGTPCYRHNGEVDGGWVVLDYVHVVVHLFTSEVREFYQIEDLWKGREDFFLGLASVLEFWCEDLSSMSPSSSASSASITDAANF